MYKKADVCLSFNENADYPSGSFMYSPDYAFPEYPFSKKSISEMENSVYSMVREVLHNFGYNEEKFDTPEWNPLGEVINKGDIVLVKPNWVMHKNKGPEDRMDCLVTHPSVLRAVVDYVHIALNGTGRIIVADAPMQGLSLIHI